MNTQAKAPDVAHTPEPRMRSRHTPEPWKILDPHQVRGEHGQWISSCEGGRHRLPADTANAARIVACVNACAGMADPAATITALREALNDVELRTTQVIIVSDITAQKHQLAFLLRELQRIKDVARAALAQTKRTP